VLVFISFIRLFILFINLYLFLLDDEGHKAFIKDYFEGICNICEEDYDECGCLLHSCGCTFEERLKGNCNDCLQIPDYYEIKRDNWLKASMPIKQTFEDFKKSDFIRVCNSKGKKVWCNFFSVIGYCHLRGGKRPTNDNSVICGKVCFNNNNKYKKGDFIRFSINEIDLYFIERIFYSSDYFLLRQLNL